MASNEIEQCLKVMREDHRRVTGAPFTRFFCPILLRDERADLCMGHVVNEAIPNSFRGRVVQRADVDGFFGRVAEAEITTWAQLTGLNPVQVLFDSAVSKRMRPLFIVDGGRLPNNWSSCYGSLPGVVQGGTHGQAKDR